MLAKLITKQIYTVRENRVISLSLLVKRDSERWGSAGRGVSRKVGQSMNGYWLTWGRRNSSLNLTLY